MRWLSLRPLVARYAVATTFLLLVAAGDLTTALLGPQRAAALRLWASTNVANLHQHPMPALVLSAFLVSEAPLAWLVLIPLAMFGANRALGNLRLTVVCIAGHVIGTAVSEGIVAYRVAHGLLPQSFAHILDIGPSYIVVAAVIAAGVFGSWPARAGAAAVLAVLVFVGHIFAGLASLNVAAVGHLTAMVTAAVLAMMLRRAPSAVLAGTTSPDAGVTPAGAARAVPAVVPVAAPADAIWTAQASQDAAQASQEQSGDLPA